VLSLLERAADNSATNDENNDINNSADAKNNKKPAQSPFLEAATSAAYRATIHYQQQQARSSSSSSLNNANTPTKTPTKQYSNTQHNNENLKQFHDTIGEHIDDSTHVAVTKLIPSYAEYCSCRIQSSTPSSRGQLAKQLSSITLNTYKDKSGSQSLLLLSAILQLSR